MHSDAAGHPGASLTDSEHTTLWRNGKLVGESEYAGSGEFAVPPGRGGLPACHVGEAELHRPEHRGGIPPGPSGRGHDPRPAHAGPTPAVDGALRAAAAGRQQRSGRSGLRRTGTGAAAARRTGHPGKKLAVDVSYDGGKTWGKAKLVRTSADGWSALLRHPAGAGHVSLRATARDTAGNTVTQRIIQAYRLR